MLDTKLKEVFLHSYSILKSKVFEEKENQIALASARLILLINFSNYFSQGVKVHLSGNDLVKVVDTN